MIRKFLALAGLFVLGFVAVAGPAQAYTAPSEGALRLLIDQNDIRLGDGTPFESQDLMPFSEAEFSITAPAVKPTHLPITVTKSADGPGEKGLGDVGTTTASDGHYAVSGVLPTAGVYTITSAGTDRNGDPSVLSFELTVGPQAGGIDNLTKIGYAPLIGGAALAVVGAVFLAVARRRHDEEETASAGHAA